MRPRASEQTDGGLHALISTTRTHCGSIRAREDRGSLICQLGQTPSNFLVVVVVLARAAAPPTRRLTSRPHSLSRRARAAECSVGYSTLKHLDCRGHGPQQQQQGEWRRWLIDDGPAGGTSSNIIDDGSRHTPPPARVHRQVAFRWVLLCCAVAAVLPGRASAKSTDNSTPALHREETA